MKAKDERPAAVVGDSLSSLEMMLIDEYLQEKGYPSVKSLCKLEEHEAKRLMMEACRFASLKLAEIESRHEFRKEIHYEEK